MFKLSLDDVVRYDGLWTSPFLGRSLKSKTSLAFDFQSEHRSLVCRESSKLTIVLAPMPFLSMFLISSVGGLSLVYMYFLCNFGFAIASGSATPRVSTAKSTIPTVAPPTQQQGSVNGVSGYASNGKVMFGGGLISGSGAKSSIKAETPRTSSMDPYAARGNIHAVGESLHIKRMLSGSDPEEVKNAGNEQYKKGNFQEALTLYDRAIILAPGKAPYRSNRAAALTGLGRLAEAVKECEEAIKLDPNYLRAHQRLASLHLRYYNSLTAPHLL